MDTFEQQRRSFLLSMGSLGISQALPQAIAEAQTTELKDYYTECQAILREIIHSSP